MKGLAFKTAVIVLCFSAGISLLAGRALSHGDLTLPPLPEPEDYGDVLMNRVSAEKDAFPVIFSHSVHRAKYTCRVCHGELDFAMKSNETGVVCGNGEVKNRHCTACHNGTISFAPKDEEGRNCSRCHGTKTEQARKIFYALKKSLPSLKWGSEIDWGKALAGGLITPKTSLSDGYQPIILDQTLSLEAEMSGIPAAIFPHKAHVQWLDCSNCHPDIFNIKKKTTKHFSMARILNGEFCGVCHLRVAFPMDECKKCHPTMRKQG